MRIEIEAFFAVKFHCLWLHVALASSSSLRRELHFLLSHTVHHYALIAMILARHGVEVEPDFGVAPSTLRHWARQEQSAKPAG